MDTDLGQAIVEKATKKAEAKRVTTAKELSAVRRRQEKELPPLRDAVRSAEKKAATAQAAFEKAQRELARALGGSMGLSQLLSNQVESLQHELRETADPVIAALVTELGDELHLLRSREVNPETGERLQVLRDGIAAAKALELETGIDVRKRLDKIRADVRKRLDEIHVAAISSTEPATT